MLKDDTGVPIDDGYHDDNVMIRMMVTMMMMMMMIKIRMQL